MLVPRRRLGKEAVLRRLDTPPFAFALREEARLRGLFDRALLDEQRQPADAAHAVLRDAVCAFVLRAKSEGHQIETVIVALKEIFAVSDRPSRSLVGDDDAPPQVLLARRVVRWCIGEYFDDGPPPVRS